MLNVAFMFLLGAVLAYSIACLFAGIILIIRNRSGLCSDATILLLLLLLPGTLAGVALPALIFMGSILMVSALVLFMLVLPVLAASMDSRNPVRIAGQVLARLYDMLLFFWQMPFELAYEIRISNCSFYMPQGRND